MSPGKREADAIIDIFQRMEFKLIPKNVLFL